VRADRLSLKRNYEHASNRDHSVKTASSTNDSACLAICGARIDCLSSTAAAAEVKAQVIAHESSILYHFRLIDLE
jgi:hypothetical protein